MRNNSKHIQLINSTICRIFNFNLKLIYFGKKNSFQFQLNSKITCHTYIGQYLQCSFGKSCFSRVSFNVRHFYLKIVAFICQMFLFSHFLFFHFFCHLNIIIYIHFPNVVFPHFLFLHFSYISYTLMENKRWNRCFDDIIIKAP